MGRPLTAFNRSWKSLPTATRPSPCTSGPAGSWQAPSPRPGRTRTAPRPFSAAMFGPARRLRARPAGGCPVSLPPRLTSNELLFCPGQPVRGHVAGYAGPPIRSAARETGTLAAFAVSYGTRNAGAHSSVVEHSPYKRGVTGSNPVAPTRFLQLDGLFETLIGDPVTTAGNHRCMLPDGEGCPRGMAASPSTISARHADGRHHRH